MNAVSRERTLPETSSRLTEDVILRAENITKVFPGTVALEQVNFNELIQTFGERR
jgi:hypothetical protein